MRQRPVVGEDRIEGLIPQDINGDGYIVNMRVPDPKGEWKKDKDEPRLMVQREPGEEGGEYYRVYPEGMIRDYNGVHVKIEKPFDGNMNRNFPINWSPREYNPGEYPLSEPEAMGMARLILDHPNIAGMCAYHTHGGIILRPSMMKMDADMSPRDLALYKDLGAVGTRLTGYPVISTYEDFTPDKTKARHGSLKDWVYEEMGIICFDPTLGSGVHRGRRQEGLPEPRAARLGHPEENLRLGDRECRRPRFPRLGKVRPPAARPGRDRRHGLYLELPQPARRAAGRGLPQQYTLQHAPRRGSAAGEGGQTGG